LVKQKSLPGKDLEGFFHFGLPGARLRSGDEGCPVARDGWRTRLQIFADSGNPPDQKRLKQSISECTFARLLE